MAGCKSVSDKTGDMTRGRQPMTLQEAAERLGVHYMTAYRYVRTGKLPAEKVGVHWMVDRTDVGVSASAGMSASMSPTYVARSQSQAPDIDSVVYVGSAKKLHAGQFVNVKVTDYRAYDLVAEVARSRARQLPVLSTH